MNNILGQPVEGDDFFDREKETEELALGLEDGNHVLLLAPRRVGKTSLAIRVGNRLVGQGWKFVLVDVQKAQDEVGFLDGLFQDLKSAGVKVPVLARLTEWIGWARRNLRGKVEGGGFGIEIPGSEGAASSTLEHQVECLFREIEESGDKVLIVVDELPVFLDAIEDTEGGKRRLETFLNWFRALRLRYRKQIRWLLMGSVGLDTFTEARRLSATINDLQTASLGAYDEPTALAFLHELGRSKRVTLSDEVCRAVVTEVGWPLPFFLQLVFHQLHVRLGRPARAATVSDVAAACADLLRPEYYRHFEPWRERLAEGLDADQYRVAILVLNNLCLRPVGSSRDALLQIIIASFVQRDPADLARQLSTVLGLLERDGYILRENGSYAFRSFLLRQYWHTREVA